MDIGIGLPNTVPGVDRAGIVDWARRSEQAGFASLGTIDRLVYSNYESLIVLAAAAAVTERIRLTTDVLLAPLHGTALLAKQTATLDSLSGGRLVLGMAIGGREDDYRAAGVDFGSRGKIFDRQLDELTAHWAGDTGIGPVPSAAPRPQVLIGGGNAKSYRRVARHADGWTMGGGTPDMVAGALPELTAAWEKHGRDGKPRVVVLSYYALGADAEQQARDDLGHYYGFLGDYAEMIIGSAAKDADTVGQYIEAFTAVGVDELILFPTSADPAQVELLADAVPGGLPSRSGS